MLISKIRALSLMSLSLLYLGFRLLFMRTIKNPKQICVPKIAILFKIGFSDKKINI